MAEKDLGPISFNQATGFRITCLDGPFAEALFDPKDEPGVLNLTGRQLPYRPYPLEGEQRVKTTYYSGNPEATQQLSGPILKNTVITGGWHDPFLGDSGAHRLYTILDNISRTGTSVKVEWGQSPIPHVGADNFDEVRVGIIKRVKGLWDRTQDIAWEAEFEWRGRGELVQAPTTSSGIQNPREEWVELGAKIEDADDATTSFLEQPFLLLAQIRTGMFTAENEIADALGTLGTVNALLIDVGATITSLSQLDNGTIERVRGACVSAVGALAAIEHGLLDFQPQRITVSDLALGRLNLQRTTFDTLRTVGLAREAAGIQAAALAAAIAPVVIAEVRPVPGTDLRDLALTFYGDPDAWRIIAKFNGLVGSRVPAAPSGPSDDPALPIRIPRQSALLDAWAC